MTDLARQLAGSMSDVDELMTWLRAVWDERERQLDEDERIAHAATAGSWRHDPTKHWRKPGTAWFEEAVFAGPAGADATCIAGTGETDDPQSMADAAHIARWDPNRVLEWIAEERVDIAAKRQILDDLINASDFDLPDGVFEGRDPDERERDEAVSQTLRSVVLYLAQPFRSHPGFRSDWVID